MGVRKDHPQLREKSLPICTTLTTWTSILSTSVNCRRVSMCGQQTEVLTLLPPDTVNRPSPAFPHVRSTELFCTTLLRTHRTDQQTHKNQLSSRVDAAKTDAEKRGSWTHSKDARRVQGNVTNGIADEIGSEMKSGVRCRVRLDQKLT